MLVSLLTSIATQIKKHFISVTAVLILTNGTLVVLREQRLSLNIFE